MELKICPDGQNKGFGQKSGKQRERKREREREGKERGKGKGRCGSGGRKNSETEVK